MPQIQTARYQLPFLAVGQAQKEITHNEALVLIDALISTAVIAQLSSAPTGLTEADAGKCWLISNDATGVWSAKNGQIACWTGSSWRYILPIEGMIFFLSRGCGFGIMRWTAKSSGAAHFGKNHLQYQRHQVEASMI